MVKGRKPKPTAIKKLEGNPGKRPLNEREPQAPAPAAKSLRVPRGRLGKDAARLWRDLSPLLDQLGVIKETDLAALEILCDHYGFAVEAAADLRANGLTIEIPAATDKESGAVIAWKTVKNPAAQIFRENAVAFRLLAGEFGLTPSSRSRLDVDPPVETEDLFSQFERMVNQKK